VLKRIAYLIAALIAIPIGAYCGLAGYVIATSPGLDSAINGCPSRSFPVPPASRVQESSLITVGSDHGPTTGCWATFAEPDSSTEWAVYQYYAQPANTPGWKLGETYANTRYAAFSNVTDPKLRAEIGVWTRKAFGFAGPSTVTLDISVCMCDPATMAQ
jgi:hypothetical protein